MTVKDKTYPRFDPEEEESSDEQAHDRSGKE
jgi:hypothetical protein